MGAELLLDTGPLVSLLDRRQSRHEECLSFFAAWSGTVVTSEAVLTEATHLLGRLPGGRRACLDFFIGGAAVLVPPSPASLRRAAVLVEKYQDLPMDYADATLVVLAEDLRTNLVFTLDRRGFEAYRIGDRRAFEIAP